MIADDLLERGLRDAAEAFAVPSRGVDDILLALRPDQPRRRWRPGAALWFAGAAAGVVALLVVAIVLGGGNSGPGGGRAGANAGGTRSFSSNSGAGSVASVPQPAVAAPAASGARGAYHAPAGGVQAEPRTPSVVPDVGGARIVKTGEMDLQVGKGQVPHTLDRLTAIAAVEHGYVAESHTQAADDASGAVTLRVPVQAFESTLVEVRQLPVKVISQQTSGEDVTARYVDLQARLHSLQATRAAFERIMSRATTIGETLSVQSRISDVQTQIEQLQGQLRVLGDQTSYSTLAVTVSERVPVAKPATARRSSGFAHAIGLSVNRFVHGLEAIISILGPVLLVALVAAVLLLAGRLAYRRLRRHLV